MIPGEALDELIGKVKALDMDDVRRQLAADEASHTHDEPGEPGDPGDQTEKP